MKKNNSNKKEHMSFIQYYLLHTGPVAVGIILLMLLREPLYILQQKMYYSLCHAQGVSGDGPSLLELATNCSGEEIVNATFMPTVIIFCIFMVFATFTSLIILKDKYNKEFGENN